MDVNEFNRVLTCFTDRPTDIDISKGQLLAQIRDNLIEASLSIKDERLYVTENGFEAPAEKWIIDRIARLPLLADRILDYIPEEPYFVIPSASLIDQLEMAPNEDQVEIEDAQIKATEILSRDLVGTTSIIYLTSDAGEGKTTLINEFARLQAKLFKEKESSWLLLPIALGGRPFLRLDEVVVGALMNRLRFPYLYYDGFLELVKLGAIIPALDGFEEIFIEGSSGDAVSALGTLIQALRPSGNILIAARKAYFEYKSFDTQAKLLDSLGLGSVVFARLALNRWNKAQFLDYCNLRKVDDGEAIYNDVLQIFEESHPILTRPVLVKRLLDVAASVKDRDSLFNLLSSAPQDFFTHFINSIIDREAREKWIDKDGDPASPLIQTDEHYELLSMIALEMWYSKSDTLKSDLIDLIAETYCEMKNKSVAKSRQIIARIREHALIVCVDPMNKQFSFDHEEFKNYFIGYSLAELIIKNKEPDIRHLLRIGPLTSIALDVSVSQIIKAELHIGEIVDILLLQCLTEGPSSFTRENCGGIIIRLIDNKDIGEINIKDVTFPPDSLACRKFMNVKFKDCHFQPINLERTELNKCEFVNCNFERLEFNHNTKVTDVKLIESRIHSIIQAGKDRWLFDPKHITTILKQNGFYIEKTEGSEDIEGFKEPDEDLVLTERALRGFLRATQINENTFLIRLGKEGNRFVDHVLPELIKNDIIKVVKYLGSGRQRRFQLNVQMHEIDDASANCNGCFKAFIKLLSG